MNPTLGRIDELIHLFEIRHVSFDFWNTLAKSNPEFKRKRAQYIRGLKHAISEDDLESAFRVVSNHHNDRFLEDGIHELKSCELYDEFFKILNITGADPQKSVNDIGNLFVLNPPLFTEYLNSDWMNELNLNDRITFSITSNTAFVEGKYIREALRINRKSLPFAFMMFSDEVLSGKPGSIIMSRVYKTAQQLHERIEKYEILHIGDDEIFDCQAAQEYGFRQFKV